MARDNDAVLPPTANSSREERHPHCEESTNTLVSEKMPEQWADPDKDQGWAWAVLFGSSLAMTMFAVTYAGGIYHIVFLEEFGMSRQTTAWVTDLQSSLWGMGGEWLYNVSLKFKCSISFKHFFKKTQIIIIFLGHVWFYKFCQTHIFPPCS
jgi:hypothetical protein